MIVYQRHSTSEHQTRRIDPACRRFAAEVFLSDVVIPPQPQYAAVDGAQQPHPHVKNGRSNLVIIIEAAKDKTAFRKPGLVPRRPTARKVPLRIIDLIT